MPRSSRVKNSLFFSTLNFFFFFFPFIALEQKLAGDEFAALHPDDADAANKAFVGFTGLFGQVLARREIGWGTVNRD